jgi:hypothetical protein
MYDKLQLLDSPAPNPESYSLQTGEEVIVKRPLQF